MSISFDFMKLIPLAMTFLMFTSGIFWDVREVGSQEKTDLILAVNPLAFIIDAHRQALMYQNSPDVWHLIFIGMGVLAIIAGASVYMRNYRRYLALKVLS